MLRRPRIVPRLASVLVGLAAGALGSGAVAVPVVAAPLPDPYYPVDGNYGYDVQHYDIHDSYRFGDRRLSGVTTVQLVPGQDLSSFSLDLLLKVDSVRIDGVRVDFAKTDLHELVITPAAPLVAGTPVDVTVRYHGFPQRIRWQGERNWLADAHEVVTMNEPHMAAWWFPSNDHPSDKATFDITVTTGKRKQVVSNGVRVDRVVHGDQATTHWRMSDPMATYLAYFAAGPFAIDRGKAHGLRYFNAVSRQLPPAAEAQALRVLHHSAAVTAWLQSQLGRYPFATTGGLVTSLQVGFALENQTRPTYPSWPNVGVVVHELAHQWFGDSVSVERWRDIWLNEGFASYMELAWDEAHGGRTTTRVLHQRYHQNRDNDGYWSLDIADPCGHDAAPCPWWDLFDSAVYNRGAMALAALRNRIGDDDFHRVLRRWVRHRAGGNGRVPQFEALAERVSGEDLAGFFDAWLSAGKPPPRTAAFGL